MLSLYDCSENVRALLAVWLIVLCLLAGFVCTYTWKMKAHMFFMAGAIQTLVIVGMLEFLYEISIWHILGSGNEAVRKLADYPAILFLVIMVVLNVNLASEAGRLQYWRKNHINYSSIKEGMDQLPIGLCYYRKGGYCILVNECMQQISLELTEKELLNGEEFYSQHPNKQYAVGDRIYEFRHRDLLFRGEMIHEITAVDITELVD